MLHCRVWLSVLAGLYVTLLVAPAPASGDCVGGEACEQPCPAENSCYTDAECRPGMVCQPWGPNMPCRPSACACDPTEGLWKCTADCAGQCTFLDCDDGNPCTEDSLGPDGCVHTPVGGAELIVVETPELTGAYSLSTGRNGEIALGFSLFEIHCVAIRWGGSITTGAWTCFGAPVGAGAEFSASFLPEAFCLAWHAEDSQIIGAQIPFDSADSFSCHFGDTFALLLDGVATLRVSLQACVGVPECGCVPPYPSGLLNSVRLVIAAQRMHDFNGDGHVGLNDATEFADCMSGPDRDLGSGECPVFDSDRDNDVDMGDVAAFQRAFTGP